MVTQPAHRSTSDEPFIEVTHQDQRCSFTGREALDHYSYLSAALRRAQPEVGDSNLQSLAMPILVHDQQASWFMMPYAEVVPLNM